MYLCFSAFQHPASNPPKGAQGWLPWSPDCSGLADPDLVPSAATPTPGTSDPSTQRSSSTSPSQQTKNGPSPIEAKPSSSSSLQDLRPSLLNRGFSSEACDFYLASWRPKTCSTYEPYIRSWKSYADKHNISKPSSADVVNYLADLAKQGKSYNTINVARSALSAYLNIHDLQSVGKHEDVCRILKGVFNDRPPLPKYTETWDVDTVLNLLNAWDNIQDLCLKQLTFRTVMLLALVSGQRGQSLHILSTSDITFGKDKCVITYNALLKNTKRTVHTAPLSLPCFHNEKLCVLCHLKHYIELTKSLRTDKRLFISFHKPYHFISRDTLSRWIKSVLKLAGIDTNVFGSHSTRAASTSAAFTRDANVDNILQSAGWASDCVFKKFYLKPISNDNSKTLSQAVLDSFLSK